MKIVRFAFFVAVALLTGCSTTPTKTTEVTGTGAAVATPGPSPGSEEQLAAKVGDRVYFRFNKADLTSKAENTLSRQAKWLAKHSHFDVLMAGNCDPRGTETYNLALGYRRAYVARNYLIEHGVVPRRIQMVSYGKSCQVSPGNTDEDFVKDRVVITSIIGFNPQHCGTN